MARTVRSAARSVVRCVGGQPVEQHPVVRGHVLARLLDLVPQPQLGEEAVGVDQVARRSAELSVPAAAAACSRSTVLCSAEPGGERIEPGQQDDRRRPAAFDVQGGAGGCAGGRTS